jgi:hypothetical protein
LKELNIKCPCCNRDIVINLQDDGYYSVVFFDEQISEEEAFEKYGLCFGAKGGEEDANRKYMPSE